MAEFTHDRSLEDYRTDRQMRYAIERALQRLTEAAHRLGEDGPRLLPDVDWPKIRGFGNVLRHEYDELDDAEVWRSATDDAPRLRGQVAIVLADMEPTGRSPS